MCVCWTRTRHITCLLAAGRGVALSADSTERLSVLHIHTTGAPGPRAAQPAIRTGGNAGRGGCVAGDSPLLQDLGDEQGRQTESFNPKYWRQKRKRWREKKDVKCSRRSSEASCTRDRYSQTLCLALAYEKKSNGVKNELDSLVSYLSKYLCCIRT